MTKPVNTAAFLTAEKAYPLEIGEAPYPTPISDEIIVKTAAVAINPVDWVVQSTAFIPLPYPWILGRDVAGTIVALGPHAPPSLRLGQPVAGLALGFATRDPAAGAFQTYVKLSPPLIIAPLPPSLAPTLAAVLPLAFATAAGALFEPHLLGLPLPPADLAPPPPSPNAAAPGRDADDDGPAQTTAPVLLVWGAASSVGSAACQLARAAGHAVVATASAANFGYATSSLGAEAVFDYRRTDVVDAVVGALAAERRKVVGVVDAVGMGGALEACLDVAGRVAAAAAAERERGRRGRRGVGEGDGEGGGGGLLLRVCTVRPLPPPGGLADDALPEGVECGVVMATDVRKTRVGPAVFEGFLPRALADGRVRCLPEPEVVGVGLGRVQEGMDRLRRGVSAKKLVVVLREEEEGGGGREEGSLDQRGEGGGGVRHT
ncbi:zinc-binding oxidoreductase [Diplodia corticola]|uniref:Zinc-binding oxidoreductase n=1 Tax=Diplodia corticola TaxID=236234 RepID=A0A1J9RVN9_9PEZI|nr:zinc-binding oxidoreductase [Diplodia corticola]OJD32447.1 zinc-binding oxidoreductase [Diplodia corticola]